MNIIRRDAFTPVPWKNGGGVTHEALRVPSGDEPFRWRVSRADIGVSGPFSDFTGYHRILVLLRGAGVRLSVDGAPECVLRQAGDWLAFDGGRPTRSVLLEGPCSDLNLMVSTSLAPPRVSVETLTARREPSSSAAVTLIFPIAGALSFTGADGEPGHLGEWDLAVLRPGEAWSVGPATPEPCLVFLATLEDNSG